MTRPVLILTMGLPGCGKTTRARQWVAAAPGRTRINRDDLRETMFGGWTGLREHEDAVTVAQEAAIRALLATGYDVVADDTNLHPKTLKALADIAKAAGADALMWDMTDVPVDVCVGRDAAREQSGQREVGEQAIRRMHARWLL